MKTILITEAVKMYMEGDFRDLFLSYVEEEYLGLYGQCIPFDKIPILLTKDITISDEHMRFENNFGDTVVYNRSHCHNGFIYVTNCLECFIPKNRILTSWKEVYENK